jgi:hypothetical protein
MEFLRRKGSGASAKVASFFSTGILPHEALSLAESREKPGFVKVRTTIHRRVWRREIRENPQMLQIFVLDAEENSSIFRKIGPNRQQSAACGAVVYNWVECNRLRSAAVVT